MKVFLGLGYFLLAMGVSIWIINGLTQVGPHCPGMPPAWLGYCNPQLAR